MTKEYIIRQMNADIEVFESVPFKPKISVFKGNIDNFKMDKFMKRLRSGVSFNYLLRCSIAAFCYGFYVRLLF